VNATQRHPQFRRCKQLFCLKGHEEAIYSVKFSHDGSHILTAGSDGKIIIWDLSCLTVGAPASLSMCAAVQVCPHHPVRPPPAHSNLLSFPSRRPPDHHHYQQQHLPPPPPLTHTFSHAKNIHKHTSDNQCRGRRICSNVCRFKNHCKCH
jgi:WD40 repeat protein